MKIKNIESIVKNKNCTGCGVCQLMCQTGAISFEEDCEGFKSPRIAASKCIGCGVCLRKCPSEVPVKRHSVKLGEFYIVQSKEHWKVKKSASGGVFYTIAKYFINELQGVVFGVAFDKDNIAKHIYTERLAELPKMQNSKYVQSDLGNSFKMVKKFLKDGRYVLFSGTPCQVAGLYAYLRKSEERLFTADIICHGVSSPRLLQKQIEEYSHLRKGKIQGIFFRHKHFLFPSESLFYMVMKVKYGLPIVRNPNDTPYFNIFLKGLGFRESCYNCQYANENRVGDFTMGDCDSHRLYPQFHPNESNSSLMLNSVKAKEMWNKKLHYLFDSQPLDIAKEIEYNKQLHSPSARPDIRDKIYCELQELPWGEFAKKYARQPTTVMKARSYLALVMPFFIIKVWSKRNEQKNI